MSERINLGSSEHRQWLANAQAKNEARRAARISGDVGVVEGAAGGHEERVARDVLKTLEQRGMRASSGAWLRGAVDALARDVLALVADREALLERIKELEAEVARVRKDNNSLLVGGLCSAESRSGGDK